MIRVNGVEEKTLREGHHGDEHELRRLLQPVDVPLRPGGAVRVEIGSTHEALKGCLPGVKQLTKHILKIGELTKYILKKLVSKHAFQNERNSCRYNLVLDSDWQTAGGVSTRDSSTCVYS